MKHWLNSRRSGIKVLLTIVAVYVVSIAINYWIGALNDVIAWYRSTNSHEAVLATAALTAAHLVVFGVIGCVLLSKDYEPGP